MEPPPLPDTMQHIGVISDTHGLVRPDTVSGYVN
jgi:hypothetical protein